MNKVKNFIQDFTIRRFLLGSLFLGVGVIGLFLGFWGSALSWDFSNNHLIGFLVYSLVTVGPELAGISIGILFIDYFNEHRQDEQLKNELIIQLGSKNNDVADSAARTMLSRGWLSDGTLDGVNLMHANLKNTDLSKACLSNANLMYANLEGAKLDEADLSNANLSWIILNSASLIKSNLENS